MSPSRRNILLGSLFGASCVGLRALATGIPASILLNPRRALAGPDGGDPQTPGPCAPSANPQFVIFQTSALGDPINANAPGSYIPGVYNCPEATLPTAMATLGKQSYQAAAGWAALPGDRTSIWHLMTNTPVHPHEPSVLGLNAAMVQPDMFPSWLARQLQPCLGTVQAQPISIGATTPSEGLTYQGAALPIIPPRALQATLTSSGILSTTNLLALRDRTLGQLDDVYLKSATRAQRSFVQSLVTSEQQVREIPQALLANLSAIRDNSAGSQALAAVILIQMKISPLVAIHVPFGGDNHADIGLATEGAQTITGLATLNGLIGLLGTTQMPGTSSSLSDLVSVVSLNVFGRTLNNTNTDGRQHNLSHQVSFAIGKPFRGGVYGGPVPLGVAEGGDFGALPIDSTTGVGSASGDVKPVDTLAAFAMTVATGVGVPPPVVQSSNQLGPQRLARGPRHGHGHLCGAVVTALPMGAPPPTPRLRAQGPGLGRNPMAPSLASNR